MPSVALLQWLGGRSAELDEFAKAHTAVGGSGRGRRYDTGSINHMYAVLIAAHFQGFCRDLHSEAADYVIRQTSAQVPGMAYWIAQLVHERALDKRSATAGHIGSDFGRFGFSIWKETKEQDWRNEKRHAHLESLSKWRNAIAHQNFDRATLGDEAGSPLRLARVRVWRDACTGLARSFDDVVRVRVREMVRTDPW